MNSRHFAAFIVAFGIGANPASADITATGDVTVSTLEFGPVDPQPPLGPGDTDLGLDRLIGIGTGNGMLEVDGGNVLRAGRLVGISTVGTTTVAISGPGSRIELATSGAGNYGPLDLASQGTANVAISDGGALELITAPGVCGDFACLSIIGNAAGTISTYTITGSGSTLDLDIGTPQPTVFGQDAVFTLAQDGFDFGTAGATTEVTIDVLDGGTFLTRFASVASSGLSASGNGNERVETTITVDGTGSVWDDAYLIFMGYNVAESGTPQVNAVSDAQIIVSNGGTVNTPQMQVGPGGIVDILAGGQINTADVFSRGMVTVSGAGASLALVNSLSTSGSVTVSGNGFVSSPLLGIDAGGHIQISDGAVDSGVVQVDGQLEMSGAGSLLSLSEAANIFGVALNVGVADGVGTAAVQQGATITLDGFGSNGTYVGVGYGGVGDVTLESGASIRLRDPMVLGDNDGVTVGASLLFGDDLPGDGTLTLRDEGTSLNVDGSLGFVLVGVSNASFTGTGNAVGVLSILNGADLFIEGNDDLGALEAGRGGNAIGTINVSGPGTSVQLNGEPGLLSIGNNYLGAVGSGTGMLTVSQGATIQVGAGVGLPGSFTVGIGESQGTVIVDTGGQITVDGFVRGPAAGGTVEVGGPASAGGLLQIDDTGVVSAGTIDVLQNGQLTGTGLVESDVLVSGGHLVAGLTSPLGIVGDTRVTGGQLVFRIGGSTPNQYGQVTIGGALDIVDGEIVFELLNGFTPSVGDSFVVLNASAVNIGTPDIVIVGLPGGVELDVTIGADGIMADVVAADTDDDGIIDTSDNCTLIANPDQRDTNADGFGNVCDADLTNDCNVNFPDLNAMKAAFFSSPASPNWNPDADLNSSGAVNFPDLNIMKAQFFGPPGPSALATCN